MPDATCKTCPFWQLPAGLAQKQAGGSHPCRVRSPAAYSVEMVNTRPARDAAWPYTNADDWCGEHPLRQRDHLAAMAIAVAPFFGHQIPGESPVQEVARRSYEIADAMLAEAAKAQG